MGEVTREDMIDQMRRHLERVERALREKRSDVDGHMSPMSAIQHDWETSRAILHELEAGGWRPITEAPKDEPFLAWGAPYRYLCRWSDKWNEWVSDHDGDPPAPAYAPTLFQMLPAPPTTSDGTE